MKQVVALRTYTDATLVNVGSFRIPQWIPAALFTPERKALAAARRRVGMRKVKQG